MKTLVSWSTGKDSAWTLHELRRNPAVEVAGLVTTVNAALDRVATHQAPLAILEAQAEAAGLTLHVLDIPSPCPNDAYEAALGAFLLEAASDGIEAMAFGDLFLTDIRAYREKRLLGSGVAPLFPLWGRDTRVLARDMIDGGLAATVTAVDLAKLDASFAGRPFDVRLIADLPTDVDPCGENGEFHTCVTAGPMFARALKVAVTGVELHDGAAFAVMRLASREPCLRRI